MREARAPSMITLQRDEYNKPGKLEDKGGRGNKIYGHIYSNVISPPII